MNRPLLAMTASLAALAGLFTLLMNNPRTPQSDSRSDNAVMVFCAASNRAVMEAIRSDYEAETGRVLEIQYGPSQTLLSSIEVTGSGDLFLPADDSYLTLAKDKGMIAEVLPVAAQQGVIAVRKGNPKNVKAFDDLLRDDVRLVQASPDAAAIATLTRKTLQEQNLWDKLDAATTAYRTTVTEVANDVVVGAADAAIVYDAVLHTYPDLEFIEIPELNAVLSPIAVGVITGSKQPQQALHFARYLSAIDKGLTRYEEHGFRVTGGDEWAEVPELSVFAGSMLRPAIDETITEFEQREGVQVARVYNGCGILVAQMEAGQHPDAFFACDREFMQQVPDLFPESTDVSQNELVILVQKNNPHGIASLKDLTHEGLKVGIGHEKQCAMGWLTQKTLEESGLKEEVMANVTVQTPTGDMLVNQMRTGSLDAAVVYLSNAAGSADFLDAVRIRGLDCSVATQPFAIAQKSRYRQLTSRLFQKIMSVDSRQTFEAEGFRWNAQ
ncbi:MAG: substrate-binding domain-containing protein [Planctomycetaceae bacterium]